MNDDMTCVLKLSDRSCCCKISVSCFAAEVVVRVSHLCLTVLSDPKHGNPEIVDIFVSVKEIYPNFEGVCVLCVCVCVCKVERAGTYIECLELIPGTDFFPRLGDGLISIFFFFSLT